MANLPKRSIMFNKHITGIDARPYFEDWYSVLKQGVGFAELVTYKIGDGKIIPSVAEFLVDTEDNAETDTLEFIDTNSLHNGAIIRMGLADASRIVTLVHSDHLNLNGANIVLSTDFTVELKAIDDHWEVVNNYFEKVIQDKAKEVAATADAGIAEAIRIANTKLDSTSTAANADLLKNMNFHWSGQGGQPTWLWGGNDGVNHYVYNPVSFSVNYANSANSANHATVLHGEHNGVQNRLWFELALDNKLAVCSAHVNVGYGGSVDTFYLGSPSMRFAGAYLESSPNISSDERLKTIVEYDAKLFSAWEKVGFVQYQMNASIEDKGKEKARLHIGCIAQQIMRSFEEVGLDPCKYGLFCVDEWHIHKDNDVESYSPPPPI